MLRICQYHFMQNANFISDAEKYCEQVHKCDNMTSINIALYIKFKLTNFEI